MFFITFLSSLISFLASGPVQSLVNDLLVVLDRGVYRLVQTSFTLFMIMCQLNLNVIYDMAASLVDRLKALIIVFIIFKVGVSLIKYMLEPDKVQDRSKKFLINLLVCAAFLVSYNFVFSAFNELSMMIIGKPDNYKYTTLAQIANVTNTADEGMIMRLFFGRNKDTAALKNVESIGNNMAFNSLCATFPDKDSSGLQCRGLIATIGDGSVSSNYNIKKLTNISSKLDVSVDGRPGIALLLGLYMVYSVIKAAIEIGVRMFKLMLLQLVAPIAIISIASEDGVKAEPFKNFGKKYIEVFISAFTRIVAILLVTVFVSKVFTQISSIIGSVTADGYSLWIIIICIVAGYRFAGQIPKMIEDIFGKKLGLEEDKGFGKFLASMIAMPILGTAGAIGGAMGAQNWYSGVYGFGAGALGGLTAGLKGDKISDKFKEYKGSQDKIKKNQLGLNQSEGFGDYLTGRFLEGKGYQDKQVGKISQEIGKYDELGKMIEEYGKHRAAAIKDKKVDSSALNYSAFYSSIDQVKYGDSKASFLSEALRHNKDYVAAQSALDKAKQSGDVGKIKIANQKLNDAINASNKAASEMWEDARKRAGEDAQARAMREKIDERVKSLGVQRIKEDGSVVQDADGNAITTIDPDNIKDSMDELTRGISKGSDKARAELYEFTNRGAYRAMHPKNKE